MEEGSDRVVGRHPHRFLGQKELSQTHDAAHSTHTPLRKKSTHYRTHPQVEADSFSACESCLVLQKYPTPPPGTQTRHTQHTKPVTETPKRQAKHIPGPRLRQPSPSEEVMENYTKGRSDVFFESRVPVGLHFQPHPITQTQEEPPPTCAPCAVLL